MNSLLKHPLIHFLIASKGNIKVLLLQEPLFGIPITLLAPFTALYMFIQGITEVQIGLLLSVTMAGQVFFSVYSGVITDKLGRRTATSIGVFVGWGLAGFVWAISNSFWLFFIAAILNSFERVSEPGYHCLLVEDTNSNDLIWIFTWINIAGLIGVLFSPIMVLLIESFTLVSVVRGLYIFLGINMIIRSLIIRFCCTETKQGEIRQKETKSIPIRIMLQEYRNVMPQIFRSSATVKVILIDTIWFVALMLTQTFFGLYVTTELGVEERFLALFPILNAIVILSFMFVIQHKIAHVKNKIPLGAGLILFVLCNVTLVFIPAGNMILIIAFVFFVAVSTALIDPRRMAMLHLALDPKERARIMSIVSLVTIAFSVPFGALGGFLSSVDRRLPFVLTTVLFIIATIIVASIRDDEFTAV